MSWSFNKIQTALEEIRNHLSIGSIPNYTIYFVGGSLCIDFEYHPSVVLNRNGRGFFYKFPDNSKRKEVKFVMTNEMQELVNQIYHICKGRGKGNVKTRMDNLDC